MRKKIVAGNWKMNKTYTEGLSLISDISKRLHALKETLVPKVIIAPPYIHLTQGVEIAKELGIIEIAAQNCSSKESGAFTGEISATMIKSTGAGYVLIGHSERRLYFNETNELLAEKTDIALNHFLTPIYCCGESLQERQSGKYQEVIQQQVEKALFHLDKNRFSNVIIAYEPVWAIGTGLTASPAQAQEIHRFIRTIIRKKYDEATAENTTILYGGSCNPANAKELFMQPDVDGGLIGGASLKADDFVSIIQSF